MILTVTLNASIDKRYIINDFKVDEVNRVIECNYEPGGKGINVSKVAKIAGQEVTATGFVAGNAGRYIIEQLDKRGIKNKFTNVLGESRSCINIYDKINKTQTELLEPGVNVSKEDEDRLFEAIEDLLPKCSVVTISGSAPRGTSHDIYQKIIALGKEYGKKVILDTSGQRLIDGIDARPTMIKPNIDEIQMLAGRKLKSKEELVNIAKEIQKQGIEIVVISLGKDGSLIVSEEGAYRATVPEVKAVNTVGCGDAMIAGFAIGLKEDMKLIDTIRLASAISVASALREETGYFVKEDMEDMLDKIEISKL